jgi:mRNA-degrading endonuclease RelE of RelBE toxin-antitoxin system
MEFVELKSFTKTFDSLFNDEGLRALQNFLRDNPTRGDLIPGGGGLRKVRFADPKRNKGKRSGLRIIYYLEDTTIYLLMVYGKDVRDDISPEVKKRLRQMIKEGMR